MPQCVTFWQLPIRQHVVPSRRPRLSRNFSGSGRRPQEFGFRLQDLSRVGTKAAVSRRLFYVSFSAALIQRALRRALCSRCCASILLRRIRRSVCRNRRCPRCRMTRAARSSGVPAHACQQRIHHLGFENDLFEYFLDRQGQRGRHHRHDAGNEGLLRELGVTRVNVTDQ